MLYPGGHVNMYMAKQHPFIHYTNSLGQRYCTIRYHEANNMLSVIWKGTAPEESIRQVEKGLLAMLLKFQCRTILNDVQDFYQAPAAFLSYLTQSDWDKKVLEVSGVCCIANVLAPSATLPQPVEGSDDSPEIRYFSHKMDALEWLHNFQQSFHNQRN